MGWVETGSDWARINASIQKYVGRQAPGAQI